VGVAVCALALATPKKNNNQISLFIRVPLDKMSRRLGNMHQSIHHLSGLGSSLARHTRPFGLCSTVPPRWVQHLRRYPHRKRYRARSDP
jgi:hypothetical protein